MIKRSLMVTFALALLAAAPQALADTAGDVTRTDASGPTAARGVVSTPRLAQLDTLSVDDLEKLYRSGTTAGGLPTGQGIGRALFPGLPWFRRIEDRLRRDGLPTVATVEDFIADTVWHGKTFHAAAGADRVGTLTNDVLGSDIATADIRVIGESDDADEADTFYLDYSHSDVAAVRGVQDYLRKVDEGFYLGKAFVTLPGPANERVLLCYFALEFAK